MANARLRMARQAGKRRRSNDPQPAEESAAEMSGESIGENNRDPLKNKPQTPPAGDVSDAVHEAFQAQKQAIEERLHTLTMGKPLPKGSEPGFDINGVRLKRAHRDFLLQEMEWMAADFAQERKWRLKSARVLSLSVVSFHSKQTTRAARQQKMEEEAKRRLAARIGRDVKKFWTKIDKIISYKVKLQADELRKAAMDKHLKHLVSQTERYASALAMMFQEAHGDQGEETTVPPHQERFAQIEDDGDDDDRSDRKRAGELEEHNQSGDDFEQQQQQQRIQDEQRGAEEGVDQDRETDKNQDEDNKTEQKREEVVQAEASDSRAVVELEASGCERTAEEVESLVQPQLSRDPSARSRRSVHRSAAASVVRRERRGDNGVSSDSDYAMPSDDEKDDEETIAIDEQMTTKEEVDEEVALLEEEGELSIDELRARYAAAFASGASGDEGGAKEIEEDESKEVGESSGDDGDFEPSAEEVEDDERTIDVAERNDFTAEEVDEEIRLLQEEGELSIEELRTRYAVGAASEDEQDMSDEEESAEGDVAEEEDDDDDDFQPTDEEPDDETTIAAAEQNGLSREEIAEEVSLLREEGELSIEELRARYASAGMNASDGDGDEEDGDSNSESSDVDGGETSTSDAAEHHQGVSPDAKFIEQNGQEGQLVVADTRPNSSGSSAQRRNSLSSTSAPATGFKRPYLLTSRLSLREYQEAGVNWLVSMCEKRINGILADEMGLGKTIQTISLLAHLACSRGIWGPHLIVVPTSCLVNWEMEFKRWCPAFKVLTYFGSAKRRKELRQGWSKQNAFQICITSYQLVVQDAHCFKRKKWYYLILDEAHNIKNWKSLRWQTLLNFNSQRRLLLTGTPLQNNIMELWSLMHFLMPHVFSSRREFTYWFQNPLASMVEGEQDVNNQLVTQLHGIIRPFVLRRLKKDVAKQMPGKFEHVVTCKLSKRQRFLYEDFISRSSTRRAMFGSGRGKGGGGANFMSMMNVLMQLRKVCNHPDLFEPRPIASPFDMPAIRFHVPSRCGFLMSDLVNEGRDLPFWSHTQNLPNLEIAGYEKYTSSRWRQLYYYDVNAPLPPETSVSDEAKERYGDKKRDIIKRLVQLAEARKVYWQQKRTQVAEISRLRVELAEEPMYGSDLIRVCTLSVFISHAMDVHVKRKTPSSRTRDWLHSSDAMSAMVKDPEDRVAEMTPIVMRAVCFVPKARARPVEVIYGGSGFASRSTVSKREFVLSRKLRFEALEEEAIKPIASKCLDVYYDAFKRTQLFFPDKRLVQFDCGKLQQLDVLLRELKRCNHRCLIFTQMSSMLNILEIFLNIHGHTYFRLDGSTKVEKRQSLMDRFNRDEKIFCFILSTRSGGLGINLTGADSVIFYDSDWNPAMDAQAQDRAHRIGQTRDVHIYRLVSEHTVEENILKKAQQKRHLDFLVMAEGQFTTDFFSKANLRELVTGNEALPEEQGGSAFVEEDEEVMDEEDDDEGDQEEPEMSYEALEDAMAQIEDEEDVVAMKGAKEEFMSEQREFEEEAANNNSNSSTGSRPSRSVTAAFASVAKPSTPSSVSITSSVSGKDDVEEEDTESVDGSVAAPADETTETQYGNDVDAPETNDSVEHVSDDDEVEAEASSGDSDDSIDDDDDDDEITQAGRKRKRANSRTTTNTSRQTKSRRQNGDTAATNARQQQRASDRAKEKARDKQIEMEEERKLQAWKDSVSSLKGFEDSLNPVDRYALHFREQIDPLYAYVPTAAAIESYFDSQHGQLDIEKIEEEKMVEEANLIADGELIAGIMDPDGGATMSVDGDDDSEEGQQHHQQAEARTDKLHRVLYKKERAHVHSERRRRQLTGAAWEIKKCAITNQPFFFNMDTREAIWDRPSILAKNEQFEQTRQLGYAGLMPNALLAVVKCLSPYPDRHHAQLVCKSWQQAANHPSLFLKVNANDLYTRGVSLSELLSTVTLGDTVIFGSGVYHVDETVEVRTPIKLLAAPDSHVELQMTRAKAQLRWTGRGGMLCGFHLTRQSHADGDAQVNTNGGSGSAKSSSSSSSNWQNLLHVVNGGQVRVMYCDFDGSHQGNACIAVSGSTSSRAVLLHNRIYNGGSSGVLLYKGDLVMVLNSVYANTHSGVSVLAGNALLRRNKIQKNGRFGIRLLYHAGNIIIEENIVNDNPCGNIDTENSGRRFVVRWNEMSKDEPDDLPHSHGKLLLKTFQIVEREILRKSSTPSMNRVHIKTPVANSELPQATDSTAGAASALPAAGGITIPPTAGIDSGPVLTVSAAVVAVPPSQDSIDSSVVKTEVSGLGEASDLLETEFAPAEAPVKQASDVEMTSTSELAVTNAGDPTVVSVTNSMSASIEAAKPAGGAAILPEPVPAVNSVPGIDEASATAADGPTTTTTAQPPTTIFTTTPTSATTTAAATTTSTTALAQPSATTPVTLKRKRRPKMEKLLVDGRMIVFHDTCEKREDKVKKPRKFKLKAAEAATPASTSELKPEAIGAAAPVPTSEPIKSDPSSASTADLPKQHVLP